MPKNNHNTINNYLICLQIVGKVEIRTKRGFVRALVGELIRVNRIYRAFITAILLYGILYLRKLLSIAIVE